MDVRVGLWRRLSTRELMLLNCGVGEDFWEGLDCKEIKPVNTKEISPEYSLEGLMLKLKLQYLATWCKELTHLKRLWWWERLKTGERDDRGWDGWMASPTRWTWVWLEQALGVGDGQGSLSCCSPWGCKECDTTERLNWTDWFCISFFSHWIVNLYSWRQINGPVVIQFNRSKNVIYYYCNYYYYLVDF